LSISEFWKQFVDCEISDNFPDRAIEFLSSHFYEIDSSFLNGLPISIIVRIVSNPSIQIESEDSLLQMIRCQLETHSDFHELLSFVRFEFVSVESIKDFISWSFEYFECFETFLSLSLWTAICGRLCLSVDAKPQSERYCVKSKHFVPKSSSPLAGIIAYLTSTHCGNVHDQGIVNVSGSTTCGSYVAKNAVDLLTDSSFKSLNEPNQWLCYDFKDRKVRPTHYSIRAHSSNHYLRSWIFEGSMDGSTWTELDRHTDDESTNSNHPIGTFSISKGCESRFLRLRQTGISAYGQHYLILFGLEIFGDLIE
jgi:hypothetical protein